MTVFYLMIKNESKHVFSVTYLWISNVSANRIHISESTYTALAKIGGFRMKFRGTLDIKVSI